MVKLLLCTLLFVISSALDVDPNGYILFCPCMGRFGNQADHYLGALAFAKGLNRTLVLPPWVEYRAGQPQSVQVPFSTYFSAPSLSAFHRVVTMEEFFAGGEASLADAVWPTEQRTAFCYAKRTGGVAGGSGSNYGGGGDCNAKSGNPFGPFWDTFSVSFTHSSVYGPLHYDVHHSDVASRWNEKYPSTEWPVLAFTGAPAAFPVQQDNVPLQKYLVWNSPMKEEAETYIKSALPKGPFVGIHLRNGIDWSRACEFVTETPNLFSAAQCLGYRNERGEATKEMCLPSEDVIVRQLKRAVNKTKARSVFVASDADHMLTTLSAAFKRTGVQVHKLDAPNTHLDLVILGRSNHFIGNCVSSFTAFVKRERDVSGFSTTFWAFPTERRRHDSGEL